MKEHTLYDFIYINDRKSKIIYGTENSRSCLVLGPGQRGFPRGMRKVLGVIGSLS